MATIILVICSLALLGALIDTQNQLRKAQKQTKSLRTWGSKAETYIKHLEVKNLAYQSTIETLTIKLDGKQYTLPLMPAKIVKKAEPTIKVETTAPATPEIKPIVSTLTIASLGALSATEQRLIDKWIGLNHKEYDMCKWLLNMRNNANKQQTAKVA